MDNIVFGALESPVDLRNYKAVCCATATDFPKEYVLYKPHTKYQGGVGSCVAHALSSVVEYFNHEQEGTDVDFSTAYIYGNRQNSKYTGVGMYTTDALKNLRQYGDCPVSSFKGNTEIPDAIKEFEDKVLSVFPAAYPHRISSYFVLDGESSIKSSLMQYGPVVICVTWRIGTKLEDGNILRLHPETKADGGHCMYIYGWNETGWLVGNSWGNLWGKSGTCVLPYDEKIREVYGVSDNIISDSKKDQQISDMKKRIADLKAANDTLQKTIEKDAYDILQLSNEVSEMSIQLFELERQESLALEENVELKSLIDEMQGKITIHLKQIETLQVQVDQYKKEKAQYEASISDYQKTIEQLNKKLIEIEKPFNSAFGEFVAKILNAIINLFRSK